MLPRRWLPAKELAALARDLAGLAGKEEELEREGVVYVRRGQGTFVMTRRQTKTTAHVAREIANKALRETYRHGLLASDLLKAIQELAPETTSGR